MNGKTAKFLKKLIEDQNFGVLIELRNDLGEATENMSEKQLYKQLKRKWNSMNVKEKREWKRKMSN